MALIASRGIGNAGTMEIHDDGSTVVMRIRSSDGSTYSGGIPISVYVGGGWSGWFNVAYPSGSPWVNVWAGGIGDGQSVAFQVGDTGTWGFGGGGVLWGDVNRATVPPAPKNVAGTPDQITATGMRYQFRETGNGGSAIIRWEYQCSTTADFSGAGWTTAPMSGDVVRSDLIPGTTYYWRARGVNSEGNGARSAVVSARTLGGGRVRVAGVWKDTAVWLRVLGVWKRAAVWEKVAGVWKRVR